MTAPQNSQKKKGRVIGVILLVVVLGVIVAVVMYLRYRRTHIITDDAFIEGNVYAVSARIPGKVSEVLVSANQYVEADAALFRLDTADTEAELAAALFNLEVVKNQVAGQRASLEVVAAQIEALKAQKKLLDKEKDRFGNLLSGNHIAKDDYDRVLAQWEGVNAQIAAAEKQGKQIEAMLGAKGADGNESAVSLAQAQVDRIKLRLAHAEVRAPADGFVTRKNVLPGMVVAAGQPVMTIVPLDGVWIVANYKETDLTLIRPGQEVVFTVDAFPGGKFRGEVESIMAGTGAVFSLLPPENATGNYIKVVQRVPVKIKILDADPIKHPFIDKPDRYEFRLGMSVVPVVLVPEE